MLTTFERKLDDADWSEDGPEIDSYTKEMALCLDVFLQANVGKALARAKERPDLVDDWNKLRSGNLVFKGVGINTLGALLYELRRTRTTLVQNGDISSSEEHNWLLDRISEVASWDWSLAGDTFRGTLVRGSGDGSRVVSSTTAVSNAVVLIRARLGLLDALQRKTAENILTLMGEVDGDSKTTTGEIKVAREVKDRIRMAIREE